MDGQLNKRKGAYRMWFSLFVALGFLVWVGGQGVDTGITWGDTNTSINKSINQSEDPGFFDSMYLLYDVMSSTSADYPILFWMVVVPITLLSAYTVVSWLSPGGGG